MASLPQNAEDILAAIKEAGDTVRSQKAAGEDISESLAKLQGLKAHYTEVTGEPVPGAKPSKKDKKKNKVKAEPAQQKKDKQTASRKSQKGNAPVSTGPKQATHTKPSQGSTINTVVSSKNQISGNSGMYAAPHAYGDAWKVDTTNTTMYHVGPVYGDAINPPLPEMCAPTISSVTSGSTSSESAEMQQLESLINSLHQSIKRAEDLIQSYENEAGIGGNFIGKHGEVIPLKWKQPPSAKTEITITAHPEKLSSAIFVLLESLKQEGVVVDVKEYWHCCNNSGLKWPSPEKIQQIRLQTRNTCSLRVVLIWKEVEHATMIVSASQHIPIEGEANIVKFLARSFCPALYPTDVFKATHIDSIIDLGDKLYGNARNQKLAMKEPNTILGKTDTNPFLCGVDLSLGDIYFWSCVEKSGSSVSGNVKKWKARVDALGPFAAASQVFGTIA